MRRETFGISLLLWLLLVSILCSVQGLAQSSDGPYYVVDPMVAQPTRHVYRTIPAALAALRILDEQGWGATLVIYPGKYHVGNTLVIDIPGLKVITRDGADRTQLVPAPGFIPANTPLIKITAQNVRLEDLKITGSVTLVPGTIGIQIDAPDCELINLVVDSHTANNGIVSAGGADRLSIVGSRVLNNGGTGISLTGCHDVRIEDSEVRSNFVGINLTNCDRASVSANTIVGNSGNGIAVTGSRSVVISGNPLIANNNLDGIVIQNSVDCYANDNTVQGNANTGIHIVSSTRSVVSENALANNVGGGIRIDNTGGPGGTSGNPSVANVVSENTVEGQEGPVGGTIPAVPGIQLAGGVLATRVTGNVLSKNTWGINLVGIPFNAPPFPGGNTFEDNTIRDSSKDGVFIIDSAGNNVFRGNEISDCTNSGVAIIGSTVGGDRFESNTIRSSGGAGIVLDVSVTAPPYSNITDVVILGNTIRECGTDGILIRNAIGSGNAVTNTIIVSNSLVECSGIGINVNDPTNTTTGLRIEENDVAEQEGDGIRIAGSPGCLVRYNNIHQNDSVGMTLTAAALLPPAPPPPPRATVERNFVWANRQGGIALNAAGLLVLVEGNSIFDNLGFGVSMTNIPPPQPPPSPMGLPQGYSLARNWWGDSAGPSGAFAGSGNATLGLEGRTKVLSPILPAPPFAAVGANASPILDLRGAQVVFIDSFAAKKVTVNRVDTAHLHLTFTRVSERNTGWVNTVPFTTEAVQTKPFDSVGRVVSASAVLVTGIRDGVVEVAFEYDPSQLPNGVKEEELGLFVYQDGTWELSDKGVWTLDGGTWSAIKGCSILASHRVVGELPVSALLGSTNAIALVAAQLSGSE